MRKQTFNPATCKKKQGQEVSTFQCSELDSSYLKTQNIRETETTIKTSKKFISRCSSPKQKSMQNHQKISLSSLVPKAKQFHNIEIDTNRNKNKLCFCFEGGEELQNIDFGYSKKSRNISLEKKIGPIQTPVNELIQLQKQGNPFPTHYLRRGK